MRIGIVSREYPEETGTGGVGTYTFHLAHGLSARGHQVHVIAQSRYGERVVPDGPVTVHRIAHTPIFGRERVLREWGLRMEYSCHVNRVLQRVIQQHAIELVEAPNCSGEGFVYSFAKRTPLVVRLHTPFAEYIELCGWKRTIDHSLSCLIEDAGVLRSDLVTCSTANHSESIASGLRMDPKRIVRIPLGVPLPDLREPPRIALPRPTVLFVGRLEKRKGVHVLLQAIPRVLQELPHVYFMVIGRDTYDDGHTTSLEGELRHSFKWACLQQFPAQLLDRVRFLGYVEPQVLSHYYRACDLFVAPSLYESFGFIYIEAMSYAKPVIGCGVGGVLEVVKNGVTGSLIPPEDPQQLADAIIRLLKDESLRRTMGERARRHVEEHFTQERMVDRTLDAYQRLLGH